MSTPTTAGLSEVAWTKTYTRLGAFTVVFGWIAASHARGVEVKDSTAANLAAFTPFLSALFGFLWLWGLTVLILLVVLRYAIASRGASWAERLPIPFFEKDDVDRRSVNGRWLQGVIAFGFVAAPTLCLLVVFNTFMGTAFFTRGGIEQVNGWAQLAAFKWWPDTFADGYRFGGPKGLTYFPLVQPALYFLLFAGQLGLLLATVSRVFRGSAEAR